MRKKKDPTFRNKGSISVALHLNETQKSMIMHCVGADITSMTLFRQVSVTFRAATQP